MNLSVKQHDSMLLSYLFVVLTMALLPWAAMNNAIPLLIVLILFIVLLEINMVKGVSFVIMSMALCLPFIVRMDDSTKAFFASHFSWLNRALYVSIFLVLMILKQRVAKNKTKPDKIFKSFLFISVLVLLNSTRFGFDGIVSWLFKIICMPIFFWICYQGKEDWKDLFRMFTVFFIGMTIYEFFDFFLKAGPYMPLRSGTYDFLELYRAGSLLGNSLTLTGFLLGYHSFLLINYHLKGKLSPWLVMLSIITILMTGSRTAALVLMAEWLLFVVYLSHGSRERTRNISILFIVSIIVYVLIWISFRDYIEAFFERFAEGSEHRESGYYTTLNIFKAHPLGVGTEGTEDAFDSYAAEGWSGGMKTVDNTYLTFLITDGILCFIPFIFYFIIPFNAFFRSKRYRQYRIVIMFFIPYILCGMTFNVNAFIQLNILYFGLAGHLYRIINKEIINGPIYNHSKLQHS